MDMKEGKLRFKHSLMISQRFSAFWEGYRKAVILFYLIKGPVFLFTNRDFWADDSFFYSVCAVSLSVLTVDLVNVAIYLLIFILTCCCSERCRFRILGHIYIVGMVIAPH